MADHALNSPSDKSTTTQLLSDAQIANAVATKFLHEVNLAMTLPANSPGAVENEDSAWHDLQRLNADPMQQASLNAMAAKIENHDPSLGLVQGTVERDQKGEVTSFNFTNPTAQTVYDQKLNDYMAQGHTRMEAIADDGTNFFDRENIRGVMHMQASGFAQ